MLLILSADVEGSKWERQKQAAALAWHFHASSSQLLRLSELAKDNHLSPQPAWTPDKPPETSGSLTVQGQLLLEPPGPALRGK